jgi:hypothetical protein
MNNEMPNYTLDHWWGSPTQSYVSCYNRSSTLAKHPEQNYSTQHDLCAVCPIVKKLTTSLVVGSPNSGPRPIKHQVAAMQIFTKKHL